MSTNPAGKKWTNTFRAGSYTCEMSYSPGAGLHAQWSPAVPTAAPFSASDMAAYRRGRDNLLAEVAKAMGQGVILIEA